MCQMDLQDRVQGANGRRLGKATDVARPHKFSRAGKVLRSSDQRLYDEVLDMEASPPSRAKFAEDASSIQIGLRFLVGQICSLRVNPSCMRRRRGWGGEPSCPS